MGVAIEEELCVGCGQCVLFCTEEALSALWGKSELDREKCTDCLLCIYSCPNDAISEED